MDVRSGTTHDAIGPIDLSGVPLHFSEAPGALRSAAPALGQRAHQIITELDLTPEAIQKLQTSEII